MGLQDFDGGAHGGAALSFKRGDLVAVYDKDDESLWQGVNVQNDSMGYFPCQLVRKIAESTKLLEEPKEAKPKPPLLETLKLTEMAIPASPLSADVATVPSPIITDEQVTIQFDFCYFIFLFLFLQFEAAKAELEKQAPAPDKAGVLKVQLERKKWVESHCVVKDHILFYSKPVKKGGAPQVVHLSLQGLMVRPATHAEVSKHDLALAFVVTPVGSKSSEAHIFAAPDLSERQSWIEILTLASAGASVNGNDVKLFIFYFIYLVHFRRRATKQLRLQQRRNQDRPRQIVPRSRLERKRVGNPGRPLPGPARGVDGGPFGRDHSSSASSSSKG